MGLNLRTYLFLCLGLIAVLPALLLGGALAQRAEAEQMAQSGRETVIVASAALLAGLLLAAVLAAVLSRPIVRLAALVAAVGRGDFSDVPPSPHVWLPREVGTLIIAIRDMVVQLRARTEELERRVDARTLDLTRANQELEYQALHDSLTKLPNRTLLYDRLQLAIRQGRRDFKSVALLLIDLDRFKDVNDTLGHQAGDELLRQVSSRLRGCLRESDTVARLGGDEFAVVLPNTNAKGAACVAEALLRAIKQPLTIDGVTVSVGASMGAAVSPTHGRDADTLLRCADVAMFAAKHAGGGQRGYTPELDRDNAKRLELVSDLLRAIEGDELTLVYQPKVSLRTGEVVRVEALVRWEHPARGFLGPDQFVPLAEASGLIDALSHWVLNAALRQCHGWRAAGLDIPVSVNLSARNLHDAELPEKVGALLATWNVPSDALLIEINEHGLIVHEEQTVQVLTRLRQMGVRIAVDDFGVGNAALGYLKHLPVDQLKIDKSFVIDMLRNDRDAAIVRSTIDLAHRLGLDVVAEGVEDGDTLDRLAALGCDQAQGYYMARPLTPHALEEWLVTSAWVVGAKAGLAS